MKAQLPPLVQTQPTVWEEDQEIIIIKKKKNDRKKNSRLKTQQLKGTYHLWISRFDFFHFWYCKTTILSKNKNAFKFKKFYLKAEI